MIEVTDNSLAQLLESNDRPIIIYVWAPWCGPCKMVSAAIDRLLKKEPENYKIAKANMEFFEASAVKYAVKSTPTLILFQNGQELSRRTGALMESQISKWLAQSLEVKNNK
jgi:thioredoxin